MCAFLQMLAARPARERPSAGRIETIEGKTRNEKSVRSR
eukprot:COSAG02_NODE_39874_length_411_cov_4.695513_1_plen_38_part_10